MGSGDLNMKKSWHPQRSGNVAATQKAEAEAITERKKLQLRLQEIEEERRKEEIQKALEAAGGKRKIDRVEWMYAGPTDGQAGDGAENEAYLLGKRRIDKLLQGNDTKKLQKQPSQDAITASPAIGNPRDVAAKIREDPLLAIKRQEQQAYEAMMNDPIKRQQLLKSMGLDAQEKSKAKDEKRHKYCHPHRSHRHRDDDRDRERHSRRRRSDSRDRSRSPRRRDSEEDHRRRRRDSPDRRRHTSESEDRQNRRRRGSESEDKHDRKRHRSESAERQGRHNGRDRQESSRDRRPRDDGARKQSRSPSPKPRRALERDDPPRRYQDDRNGDRNGDRNDDRSGNRNSGGSYRPRRADDNDNRPRQNSQRPSVDSGDKVQADEERARKLAAMQEAASNLDIDRERRLAAIEEADRAAREEDDRIRRRNKKFGGDAGFTNSLHSRAADMKVADRMRTR
ncbi:pre-mRNA-splicing factor CWC25 [Podospora didyma]|uniref:Pre-mRNA-splicing factor CWC25 n=1 Tax=Podospora didyma TaxID=330526 RepID=A0AAE0N6X3_9PEZI|nr:pre-mRNA-splicing factor CWC25 [Podospora didyma]